MDISADAVAPRLAKTFLYLMQNNPGAWSRSAGGAVGIVTGIPLAPLNGVFAQLARPESADVAQLLDEVASHGVPHCLQVRPAAAAELGQLAEQRGMTMDGEVPLMALGGTEKLGPADVEGLDLRQLRADEVAVHAGVASAAFGVPYEHYQRLVTTRTLSAAGVRGYAGFVQHRPVCTALGVTLGGAVGIFSVATQEEYRGRGYGRAVTARAVADGLASGASWAWLQASALGYPVYLGLGFQTVEAWPSWSRAIKGG